MFMQIIRRSRYLIYEVYLRRLSQSIPSNKYEVSKISKHKISKVSNKKKLPQDVENNYKLCLDKGMTRQTIDSNQVFLKDKSLSLKLDILKLLPLDLNSSVPLLAVNYSRLKLFVFNELVEKKISALAKIFEVSESDVCNWMSKKTFLMTTNIDNVKQCVKILLDEGVTLEAIMNDLWVLRYSTDILKQRIMFARKNNIDTIKTWMIRSPLEIIENYARRRSDNKEILGEKKSLAEYLSEKLECSQEVSVSMIEKQPALQKKSLKKLEIMVKFLLQKGFTTQHICKTPKILLHSMDTVEKRLKEIEANNIQLDSLVVFTKSQKQYMSVIDSLKSNKNKAKT